MEQLSEHGRQVVGDVAHRHGFSSDAVAHMLWAVAAGHGTQAQFNHPEFGGMGQWSSGGMLMIGDMFNNQLKGRIGTLCQELSGLVQGQAIFSRPAQSQSQSQSGGYASQQPNIQFQGGGSSGESLFVPGPSTRNWWPADCGAAGSVGSQNNLRYAYFPASRRLAIDVNGKVTVYDAGEHQISGFSQQQSGDQSLTFTSQLGLVRVSDLPVVSGPGLTIGGRVAPPQQQPKREEAAKTPSTAAPGAPASAGPSGTQGVPSKVSSPSDTPASPEKIGELIQMLADLHKKGVLTDSEFETKKAELLSRL
jgi:Short C-terminal domain